MSEFKTPLSRTEAILQNILGDDNELSTPLSRIEKLLMAILKKTDYTDDILSQAEEILYAILKDGEWNKTPKSRSEKILKSILDGEEYTGEIDEESRIEALLREWSKGTGPKYVIRTVTGAMVKILNALAEPAVSLKVSLGPKQDLHGYDHPWPAGGGKNKLKPYSYTANTSNVTLTYSDDGTISAIGTASANIARPLSTWAASNNATFTLKAGTYTLSLNTPKSGVTVSLNKVEGGGGIVTTSTNDTFTTSEDFECFWRLNIDSGTVLNDTFTVQLESGSTATSYEPYSNICPISGWDEASVTRRGVNLANFVQNKGISSIGTVNDYAGRIATVEPIAIESGVDYVFRNFAQTIVSGIIAVYNGETLVRRTAGIKNGDQLNVSGGDRFYFCVYYATEELTIDSAKAMIVKSTDTVTEYEPYQSDTYTVSLTQAGTVYGGTIDIVSGVLSVTWAILSNLQNLNWITNSSQGMKNFQTASGVVSKKSGSDNWKCSKYSNGFIGTDKTEGIVIFNSGEVCIRDYQYWEHGGTSEEVAAFKASLEDVTIAYELATPQTYQLTPTEVQMLLGSNTVWSDGGNIELSYKAPNVSLQVMNTRKKLMTIKKGLKL